MIKPLKVVKVIENKERDVWFFPKLCIIGLRLRLPKGEKKWLYTYRKGDFVSGKLERGEVTELKTATMVVPGGRALLHNSSLERPTAFEGGIDKIGHGIHVAGDVHLEGLVDSTILCVGPREDMKGFEDKDMEWVTLYKGESHTFKEGDIGFGLIYDEEDTFRSFTVEPGDIYTAESDTVLAVVFQREAEDEA